MLTAFKEDLWPRMRREGLRRWAEIQEEQGNWNEVLLALLLLRPALPAESLGREALNARILEAARQTLRWLEREIGLPWRMRTAAVDRVAKIFNEERVAWPKSLWVQRIQSYRQAAEGLRQETQDKPPQARQSLLRSALSYEEPLKTTTRTLRRLILLNLARAGRHPASREEFLDQAQMLSDALGDPDLARRVRRAWQNFPPPRPARDP